MNQPKCESLKVLPLLESLRYLSELEAYERGTKFIIGCSKYENGETNIQQRLWKIIIQDQYGNQQFTNDSFYRWTDVTPWADHPDVITFMKHYPYAINDTGENAFVLFDVSW